ncbi:MAG: hypothetical protein IMZ43_09855 [Thermoplasmata archaeon]|nr:hypothetical protein [Thermoplasmata archaeon]
MREGKLDYQAPPPPETFDIHVTIEPFIVLSKPKPGKYTVWVRTVKMNGTNGKACTSTDRICYPKQPDGRDGGWKILWKPSGPTGLIILY